MKAGTLNPLVNELSTDTLDRRQGDDLVSDAPDHDAQSVLVDRFGRVHSSIRISVTDRCNIRCQYCMPETDVEFMPSHRLMPFELITKFVAILARVGVRKVRITGGEPLVRPQLANLILQLSKIEGIDDIALTSNGILLADQVDALVAAGLRRVNISIDTLREATFLELARRGGLQRVLDGIAAAKRSKLSVRLNTLVMRHINWDDVLPLVNFSRDSDLPLRFIEFMPLDADRRWNRSEMVSGAELRTFLEQHFGQLIPADREDPSQPANDYNFQDGRGSVGFIDSVSQPFCSQCNRLRITADGQLRNCLFGREYWDMADLLRSNATSDEILAVVRSSVFAKHQSHGISNDGFQPPSLAMYQIGG